MGLFSAGGRGASGFDAAREQQRVTEAVLRSAAVLLHDDRVADEIIAAHCDSLTALVPHLVLAWVWFGPADTPVIRPQVAAGPAAPYAHGLVIERNLLTRLGPAFRTLDGQRLEPFRVGPHSPFGPWREAARDHGVRSVLALPLRQGAGSQCGLLVLYADVSEYFQVVGVGVFEALAHLFSAVLARTQRNAELARAANCDALTGLCNRMGLAVLAPVLRRLSPHDPPCAVLMIDIDHFKRINDEHGHAGGDHVLSAVAAVLRNTVRATDTVARWGGEEFVICLPRVAAATALALAEKVRRQVAAAPLPCGGGTAVQVTLSVGVAELRVGEAVADALDRADEALYAAKRGGRDRVVVAGEAPPGAAAKTSAHSVVVVRRGRG